MTDNNRNEPSSDLLSLPYRDRQLIVVVQEAVNPGERVDVRLEDYYSVDKVVKNMNPLIMFRKDYWKNMFRKDYWKDTKNFGLAGYLIDRVRGGQTLNGQAVRRLRKVQSNLIERLLKFPPGHPLYDIVYVGHPLEPSVYVPMAGFHHFLFEEKFNELLTLLWSLGA